MQNTTSMELFNTMIIDFNYITKFTLWSTASGYMFSCIKIYNMISIVPNLLNYFCFCYYIPLWLLPFQLQTSSIVLSSTIVNVLIYSCLQLLLDLQKPSSDYRNLNHSSLFKRTKWWTCYIKQEEQGEKKAKSKWKCFKFISIPWNPIQKTLPIELGIWKDSCIHYSKEKRTFQYTWSYKPLRQIPNDYN
jgi:hypothetical protein